MQFCKAEVRQLCIYESISESISLLITDADRLLLEIVPVYIVMLTERTVPEYCSVISTLVIEPIPKQSSVAVTDFSPFKWRERLHGGLPIVKQTASRLTCGRWRQAKRVDDVTRKEENSTLFRGQVLRG